MKVSDSFFMQRLRRTIVIKVQVHAAFVDNEASLFTCLESCTSKPSSSKFRYGETKEIQCAHMLLLKICWTLFKRISVWSFK